MLDKVPYQNQKAGFVDTPQYMGLQSGKLDIKDVRKLIQQSKKTRGYTFQVATGTSTFNLQLNGTARIWLGFSLLPVVRDVGNLDLTTFPQEFNLNINNLIICDQTHPAFYTQLLMDEEYYKIPTPLSGTDIITVTWENAGAAQDWVMIAYYI